MYKGFNSLKTVVGIFYSLGYCRVLKNLKFKIPKFNCIVIPRPHFKIFDTCMFSNIQRHYVSIV